MKIGGGWRSRNFCTLPKYIFKGWFHSFFIDEKQTEGENFLAAIKFIFFRNLPLFYALWISFPGFYIHWESDSKGIQKKAKRNAVIIKADEIAFSSVSVALFTLIHSRDERLNRMNGVGPLSFRSFLSFWFIHRYSPQRLRFDWKICMEKLLVFLLRALISALPDLPKEDP